MVETDFVVWFAAVVVVVVAETAAVVAVAVFAVVVVASSTLAAVSLVVAASVGDVDPLSLSLFEADGVYVAGVLDESCCEACCFRMTS